MGTYQDKARADREKRASEQSKSDISTYGTDAFSSDKKIAQGQRVGLNRGMGTYGTNLYEIGQEVKSTRELRKKRLEGKSSASTDLRDSRNRRMRMAKRRGASPGELAQIERSAESDIGRFESKDERQRLSDYERSVTGAVRGLTGLELGYANLEKAGQAVQSPQTGSSTLFCAALFAAGLMSDDLHAKEMIVANKIIIESPDVYAGYTYLIAPIVPLIMSTRISRKLISMLVLPWVNNNVGNKNLLGKSIDTIGRPICSMVGKIIKRVA